MLRALRTGLLVALLAPVAALAQQLPTIKAEDLNKKPVSWPADFTTDRTVLIVAFDRNQQPIIDAWVSGLQLKVPGAPAWFEVPLINKPPKFVQSFINNGMRRGIPDPAVRSHVVSVYTDKKAFMSTMGLVGNDVHVLVLSRTGQLLGKATGRYSAEAAAKLEAALK